MYKDILDSDGLTFSERCAEREYYYNLDNFMVYDDDDLYEEQLYDNSSIR